MTAVHRALALVMLLTACTPRDAQFDPSHFHASGAAAPPDVVLPAGVAPGSTSGGITALAPTDESLCCPAGAHLDLSVRKGGPAATLRIGAYLAREYAHEVLRVTFSDGTVRTLVPAGSAFVLLTVSVPKPLRAAHGLQRIRIDASQAPYTLLSVYYE